MFKKITNELGLIRDAIVQMTAALRIVSDGLREASEGGADHERLAALEGRMEIVLGQVEAGLVKADALKATARAAEDRTRGHMKRAEGYLELAKGIEGGEEGDPFERFAAQYADYVAGGNDEAKPALPPMPDGMETRQQSLARLRAAKRGL